MYAHPAALPDPELNPEFYDSVPFKRLLAWLADTVVIFVLCLLALPFTAFTGLFFFPLLYLLIGFVYRWLTISAGSATWGMRLMSVELRRADGALFDGGTALMHTLGYTLSMAVFPAQLVSAAMMALTPRGQGLSDHMLGTVALNRRAF